MRFMGWAGDPDLDFVIIFSGETEVHDIGNDIYAIWSSVGMVSYHATDGYFLNEKEQQFGQPDIEYPLASTFKNVEVYSSTNQKVFAGWYSQLYGETESNIRKPP